MHHSVFCTRFPSPHIGNLSVPMRVGRRALAPNTATRQSSRKRWMQSVQMTWVWVLACYHLQHPTRLTLGRLLEILVSSSLSGVPASAAGLPNWSDKATLTMTHEKLYNTTPVLMLLTQGQANALLWVCWHTTTFTLTPESPWFWRLRTIHLLSNILRG